MLKELEPTVDLLAFTRANLRRSLEGLSVEQLERTMPRSEWSIKDALAHLAGNEALMTRALENIVSGSAETEQEFDNEAENRRQVAHGRQHRLDEVYHELEENRARLLSLLEGLTPEQLERRGRHPYQGKLNVREFLAVIYTHEETHARQIVEWARQLKRNKESGVE